MADEKSSIIPKAEALKKAGFHPVTTVLILVLSTPGIWQNFFDDTDEKALKAIEVAYPLLKRDVEDVREHAERQVKINQKLLIELAKIQTTLSIVHGIDHVANEDALEGLFDLEGDTSDDSGGGDFEAEIGRSPASSGMGGAKRNLEGPSSLESMIEQQQQVKQEELPELGELLGEK